MSGGGGKRRSVAARTGAPSRIGATSSHQAVGRAVRCRTRRARSRPRRAEPGARARSALTAAARSDAPRAAAAPRSCVSISADPRAQRRPRLARVDQVVHAEILGAREHRLRGGHLVFELAAARVGIGGRADLAAERQLDAAFDRHRAALRRRPRDHRRRRTEMDAERDAEGAAQHHRAPRHRWSAARRTSPPCRSGSSRPARRRRRSRSRARRRSSRSAGGRDRRSRRSGAPCARRSAVIEPPSWTQSLASTPTGRPARRAKPGHLRAAEARRQLEERAAVDHQLDHAADLVGAAALARDHREQLLLGARRRVVARQRPAAALRRSTADRTGRRGSGDTRRPRPRRRCRRRRCARAPPRRRALPCVTALPGRALDQRGTARQHLRGLARHQREVRRDEPRGREARDGTERRADHRHVRERLHAQRGSAATTRSSRSPSDRARRRRRRSTRRRLRAAARPARGAAPRARRRRCPCAGRRANTSRRGS